MHWCPQAAHWRHGAGGAAVPDRPDKRSGEICADLAVGSGESGDDGDFTAGIGGRG